MSSLGTDTLRLLGVVGLACGIAACVMTLAVLPESPLRHSAARYIRFLDRQYSVLRLPPQGKNVFGLQVTLCVVAIVAGMMLKPLFFMAVPAVAMGPWLLVKKKVEERIQKIEEQLDTWLLVLANALKAVPSLGDALESSQDLVHAPLSQELDIALKEYRLGAPLDVALNNMAERMNSRVLTSALSILRIARNTGGDLPRTLESAAASLREMARLEGVVRTKTADGRNQAWVLGALPAVIMLGLYFTSPDLLIPLFETTKGNVLLTLAIALWVGAIATALKILKVDI